MIYLDYNASTPIDPRVREAILPFLDTHYGNPSSQHVMGFPMRDAVDKARIQLARLLGATPEEMIFTSGGSESNNHVIKGVAESYKQKGKHIITSVVEHPASLEPCAYLEKHGYEVTYVPVDGNCLINPDDVKSAIRSDTILISIMQANNEVGTIQPIREISDIAKQHDILMHTDSAQTIGKIPCNVDDLNVDFVSIAGHKVYAPHGIGALYIRKGIQIESFIHGAGHEAGRRAGTEPMINLVALGAAAGIFNSDGLDSDHLQKMRDLFFNTLQEKLGDNIYLNGHPENRLPNTANISFMGKVGRDMLSAMPELCASPGAACKAGEHSASHVISAMKIPHERAIGAIRFSMGRYTNENEINDAVEMITRTYKA